MLAKVLPSVTIALLLSRCGMSVSETSGYDFPHLQMSTTEEVPGVVKAQHSIILLPPQIKIGYSEEQETGKATPFEDSHALLEFEENDIVDTPPQIEMSSSDELQTDQKTTFLDRPAPITVWVWQVLDLEDNLLPSEFSASAEIETDKTTLSQDRTIIWQWERIYHGGTLSEIEISAGANLELAKFTAIQDSPIWEVDSSDHGSIFYHAVTEIAMPVTNAVIPPPRPSCPNGTLPGWKWGAPGEYICQSTEDIMSALPVVEAVLHWDSNSARLHDTNMSVDFENLPSHSTESDIVDNRSVEHDDGHHIETNRTREQTVGNESRTEPLSTTKMTFARISFRLCGYPPYSNRQMCREQNPSSDPLSNCEVTWIKTLFGVMIGMAATAIILENGLIFIVIAKYSNMRTHYNCIKASLALADIVAGILLATVLPNMAWIRNLSELETIEYVRKDVNSPTAIVIGSLQTVTLQASLLHLCFLSIERFMAIQSSFWVMKRKTKSVILTLTGIWITSTMTAFLPAIIPTHFEYKFQPALLIHLFTMKSTNGTNIGIRKEGIAYTLITLILPYIIMLIFCVATAAVLYRKFRSAQRLFGEKCKVAKIVSRQLIKQRIRPEMSVYITMIIMVVAYTATLLPFFTVVALFIFGKLNCSNYTIPYTASFYIHLLNSLLNGIIYSVRDGKFRSTVKRLLGKRNVA